MNTILDDLRLSDRDRARACKRLAREHRRGRIDGTELAERLDAVGTARTHADLAPVFADLLPLALVTRRGPRFRRPPFPLLPLLVLAIIVAATGHLSWVVVAVAAAVLVLTAPLRWRHRARWAC